MTVPDSVTAVDVRHTALLDSAELRAIRALLNAALENVIRGAYQLGALGASDAGVRLYQARGWQRWRGTTSVIAPSGRRRTPEDDSAVYVLPVDVRLTMTGDLACEWREGDVW